MRFLFKIWLGVFVFSGLSMGAVLAQRMVIEPPLRQVMLTDADCGLECWFGVRLEQMRWREVQTQVEAAGAVDFTYRNQVMRLRLPSPDTSDRNRGHIQVLFEDGIAQQVCFFPIGYTIGDVMTTFGEPDYFWLDRNSQRALFSRQTYQTTAYIITFYMVYAEQGFIAKGDIQRTYDYDEMPLPPDEIFVNELCQPPNLSFFHTNWMPRWAGFWQPLITYTTVPAFDALPPS